MPRGGLYTHTRRQAGTVVTPEIYNEDHLHHIENLYPEKIDDLSDTDQMFGQDNFNPYEMGAIHKPQNLGEELESLRYQVKSITGRGNWYLPPTDSLTSLPGRVAQNFVSPSAPQPDQGTENSMWIRLNGTTLEVYQRTRDGWPQEPQASITQAVNTGTTFTGLSLIHI